MTVAEHEEFLAGVHLAVLGVDNPARALTDPVWCSYAPGGAVNVSTSGRTTDYGKLGLHGPPTPVVRVLGMLRRTALLGGGRRAHN